MHCISTGKELFDLKQRNLWDEIKGQIYNIYTQKFT